MNIFFYTAVIQILTVNCSSYLNYQHGNKLLKTIEIGELIGFLGGEGDEIVISRIGYKIKQLLLKFIVQWVKPEKKKISSYSTRFDWSHLRAWGTNKKRVCSVACSGDFPLS